MAAVLCLFLCFLVAVTFAADPLVQLKNGGLLRGKHFTYGATDVQLFLGIPYAKPPVSELRFKKPEPFPAWTGERNARQPGHICPQLDQLRPGHFRGSENCLNLDITVPGPIDVASPKPVMVWIHGGGYVAGSKDLYIGAPLAVHGDVIIVTINYRLGSLGFLSVKAGTGNFGLWDQRAALLWVQENIAQFGGDPDMVTIFGESAGSGSVSAQTLGQHNDGLFRRAIQESGTLYASWGWYLSERKRNELGDKLRASVSCSSNKELYDCLRTLPIEEIFAKVDFIVASPGALIPHFVPVPDDDFFPSDIAEETHELAQRFDVMSGLNGQEGLLFSYVYFPGQLDDGITLDTVKTSISAMCSREVWLSPELCTDYLMDEYELHSATDDKERALRLSYMLSEYNFNQYIYNGLYAHSMGSKATYAYYFTEVYDSPISTWPVPEYLIKSADHADELSFVFGMRHTAEQKLWKEYFGDEHTLSEDFQELLPMLNSSAGIDLALTNIMMTAWTNFAISGNPNSPVTLPTPAGTPAWLQFNVSSNQFMQLNSKTIGAISAPNKERVDALHANVFNARKMQVLADAVAGNTNNNC